MINIFEVGIDLGSHTSACKGIVIFQKLKRFDLS